MSAFSKRQAIVYLVAVFVAGAVAGGFFGYRACRMRAFVPPSTEKMVAHILSHLQSKLDLTADQVQNIKPLLEETTDEALRIHKNSMNSIDEVIQRFHAQVGKFLTPAQKEKLAQMDRERRQKFQEHAPPPRRIP
jgi:Spy/CpxP family protein refolding chaperone